MHQQQTAPKFQQQQQNEFKSPASVSQHSEASSASSSPSPSVTPNISSPCANPSINNHAVANLLNLQTSESLTTQYLNNSPAISPSLIPPSNGHQQLQGAGTYSPALLAAIANMSSYNQQMNSSSGAATAAGNSYPYFELANNFQQLIQQNAKTLDNNNNQENMGSALESDNFEDSDNLQQETLSIKQEISDAAQSSTSFNKKRGLSDVISKLRNNQQSDAKQEGFCQKYGEAGDEEMINNDTYESNQNESDLNEEDNEYEYQDQNGKFYVLFCLVFNHFVYLYFTLESLDNQKDGSTSSKPTGLNPAGILGGIGFGIDDFHVMSAAEQVTAIMNVVANQNLNAASSRPAATDNKLLSQRPSSVNSLGGKSIQSVNDAAQQQQQVEVNSNNKPLTNKSEMDLLKLLERANLSQYLAIFVEQG